MKRQIKDSIRSAVKIDSKVEAGSMTPNDKIKIIAYHLAGYPVKRISGIMGFSMDWLRIVIDVLVSDREFKEAALKLNISKYNGIEEGSEIEEELKPKSKPKAELKAEPKSENLLDDLGLNEDIETIAPASESKEQGLLNVSLKRRGRPKGSKNKVK